jgi:hypothetical protein
VLCCASLGRREQALLHDVVLMADSIVRETFRVITILFSIGDVQVFSGINWLVDNDRALKKPERRR